MPGAGDTGRGSKRVGYQGGGEEQEVGYQGGGEEQGGHQGGGEEQEEVRLEHPETL